jgi:hypothetical protein
MLSPVGGRLQCAVQLPQFTFAQGDTVAQARGVQLQLVCAIAFDAILYSPQLVLQGRQFLPECLFAIDQVLLRDKPIAV